MTSQNNMKIEMTFPEVFANPDLIKTREPAALCADGLSAWAVCMCGNKPPDSFGETLVAIGARLGMTKGATADNLSDHAKLQGWLDRG